ncbi:MAG: ABC transporter substrate-binding protein [Chloroflexi bacterium]|nr:ABC transporter substrate-binding protein [Chloroflexota bacterium]
MKRSLVLVLVLTLTLAVFARTPSSHAQDKVTIQLMGWSSSDAENAALQSMVDAFEEANPNIAVDLQLVPEFDTTLQAAFASGDAPNVFYVDSSKLPDLVDAGVIAAGDDQIVDQDDIYPSLLDVFTIDDTLYCAPKDFSTLTLQYNKDLFDAAGVDYPTSDWTWDDLAAAAEALTEGDVVGLVVPAELPRWLPFLYQAGGSILSEDGTEVTFDSEETAAALDFYVGLVTDGFAAPPSAIDSGWGGEALGKQRAAMAMEGNWIIGAMEENYPDVNYGIAELPAGPAGKATMAFTVCYGVAADNDHPEESWALANFLTGKDGALMVAEAGFGVMPARLSAADTWLQVHGEDFQPFVTGADYSHRWVLPIGFGDFTDTFNNDLKEAMAGNLTTEDIIADSVDVANEILGQ